MNNELEPEVTALIHEGRKIDAIKKLRQIRGLGLREAKEVVDAYAMQYERLNPSVKKSSSGGWLVFLIIIGVAGYFLYRYFG